MYKLYFKDENILSALDTIGNVQQKKCGGFLVGFPS